MAQIKARLTSDAQAKTTKEGKEFVVFAIAENYSYKPKDGERKTFTTYYNCSYWRRTAIAKHLTEGTFIIVTGQVSIREYVNRDGEKKSVLQLRVNDIEMPTGSNKKDAANNSKQKQNEIEPVADIADDLPF